ncbi:PucR family transcriptional regulator [Paenibacillus sp. NEAU-GSW1]|uniref:PucR family transcriptional regulator n=1 Tax=Paenibacillus sp. NEAU-GSW1 TaxID=2682486 RepID=UPI0012E21DE4|nr:PucR family transcriptional regulator [Paenibacillus sp. NEAU-GSW1]MUT67059.1 PucR family transcriptional regulator [Paenibacillus sp. NEAU-GSW1]
MHFTVEQALAVYPLSEGKLVAGTSGRSRIVRSVNVMDAPDITDWIKEGEMLFTTAYFIKDQPQEAAELLFKLNQRGSSALGIKLGRFWDAIPDNLIARADELGFPLIELPYEFTFSDQMNGLFREEMKRNTGVLQDVLDKQIRLMRFALKSENMSELFDAVTEITGYPIAVIGSRGQMVHNESDVDDRELLANWPWPQPQKWMKSAKWQAFRVPLMKNARCTGFVLFFNPQLFLSSPEESLYLQAAELISYHMNMKYEDYFELSAQKDFGILIKRHLKNGLPITAVIEYADRWEVDLLQQSYVCVLTAWQLENGRSPRADKIDRLKTEFLSHTRLQRLKGLHMVMDEGLLSIFPELGGVPEGEIEQAISACFHSVYSDIDAMPMAAFSGRKKKPEQLLEAFEECKHSHRLAAEWEAGQLIVKFETMDLALLFEHVSKERMEAFCNRWLGGLINRDPDYAGEMLRTLEAYLEHDGQLNETAKKLFIHRNTATYRIEKLSEILDVDFKKMNDLLRLKIAFMFRKLLNKNG